MKIVAVGAAFASALALAPSVDAAALLTLGQPGVPPAPQSLSSTRHPIDPGVEPDVEPSELRARLDYWGGPISSAGRTVRVYASDSYRPDNAWLQSTADWITRNMFYGSELESATFYFLTKSEIAADWACGPGAYGCYDPNDQLLILPGNHDPDGTNMFAVLTHEYGHHIARNRSNAPWVASTTGPKRWATVANVCERTMDGTAFPGDQGVNYRLVQARSSPRRTRS